MYSCIAVSGSCILGHSLRSQAVQSNAFWVFTIPPAAAFPFSIVVTSNPPDLCFGCSLSLALSCLHSKLWRDPTTCRCRQICQRLCVWCPLCVCVALCVCVCEQKQVRLCCILLYSCCPACCLFSEHQKPQFFQRELCYKNVCQWKKQKEKLYGL